MLAETLYATKQVITTNERNQSRNHIGLINNENGLT